MEADNRQEVQHGRRGVARRPGGGLVGGLEVEQKAEKVSETLVGRRGRIEES